MFTTNNNSIIKRIHITSLVSLASLSQYPSSPSVFFSQTSCGKTLQWELVSCERRHTTMTRGATRPSPTLCPIRRQRTCSSIPVLAGFTSVSPFHRPVCLQLHEFEDWCQAHWCSQVWGAETSSLTIVRTVLLSQHGPLFLMSSFLHPLSSVFRHLSVKGCFLSFLCTDLEDCASDRSVGWRQP